MSSTEHTTEAGADKGADYPPAPWELFGQAQMHLLLVAARDLPAPPPPFRTLVVGGRALVVAGWISYEGGSVLRYGELFAAPLGLFGRRLAATVTHMWVDSEPSMRGGRELWGYPKELATFRLGIDPGGSAEAADELGAIASGEFNPRLRVPLALRARGGTVQPLAGRMAPVKAIFRGTLLLGGGSFRPTPGGPLGHLAGARRLLSFGLRDFHFTFGLKG